MRIGSLVDVDDPLAWNDVPEAILPTWRRIFAQSTSGLDVIDPCPVCRAHDLHRWFYLDNAADLRGPTQDDWQGRGSQWQWCNNCRSYEHSSGLVPGWWQSGLIVDAELLRHDPGPVEQARRNQLMS